MKKIIPSVGPVKVKFYGEKDKIPWPEEMAEEFAKGIIWTEIEEEEETHEEDF